MILMLYIGKRNDEEGAKEKLYTYASHIPVTSFKVHLSFPSTQLLTHVLFQGLQPTRVEAE